MGIIRKVARAVLKKAPELAFEAAWAHAEGRGRCGADQFKRVLLQAIKMGQRSRMSRQMIANILELTADSLRRQEE